MRETLKRLARLSAGYSLVTLIGPLFTILLTPLYTRVLEPADYGVVDVTLTLSALLGAIAGFGMEGAVSSYFFNVDETERRNLAATAMVIVLALSFVFGLTLFVFAPYLGQLIFHQPERELSLRIVAIHVFSAPLYALLSALLRLRMGVRRVNMLGLTYLIVFVSLNLVLVLGFHLQANGVVMANAAAMFVGAAIGLVLVYQPLHGHFSSSWMRNLTRAGAALLPASLSYLLLSNIDRILLTQYVTQDEIGLYAIANKLASMQSVLVGAIWAAWWPMALQMANTADGQRKIARMYEFFMVGSILLSLALGLFSPEILRFYTREAYVPAAPYAAWLFLYMGPIGITAAFFQIGLYAKQQMRHISVALALSAVVNVVLNILLDPTLRVWGATIATVIAGLMWAGYCLRSGQKVMPLRLRWTKIGLGFVVYLCCLFVNYLYPMAWQLRVLMFTAFLLFFLFLTPGIDVLRQALSFAWKRVINL